MVSLLPDYPDEEKAFDSDVQVTKTHLSNMLSEEYPDINFSFKIFKTFWFPKPTDMSAILQVKFESELLCDDCRYRFEKFIEKMYFKINNKVLCIESSYNCVDMSIGIATYELRFNYTIDDYRREKNGSDTNSNFRLDV